MFNSSALPRALLCEQATLQTCELFAPTSHNVLRLTPPRRMPTGARTTRRLHSPGSQARAQRNRGGS